MNSYQLEQNNLDHVKQDEYKSKIKVIICLISLEIATILATIAIVSIIFYCDEEK